MDMGIAVFVIFVFMVATICAFLIQTMIVEHRNERVNKIARADYAKKQLANIIVSDYLSQAKDSESEE